MAQLLVPRQEVEDMLTERIRAGEDLMAKADLANRTGGWRDWISLFEAWRHHTLAELDAVYEGDDIRDEFGYATTTGEHSSPSAYFPYKKNALQSGVLTLASLVERLALAVEPEPLQAHPKKRIKKQRKLVGRSEAQNIFIVHGKAAGGFLERVVRFIGERGLNALVLGEQANEGRTLIEKFEDKASDTGYAVVLLTPEDFAFGPGEEPPARPNRARQNVVLELGYFMASLGRQNVAALVQEGVEEPSDIKGIVYIPLDESGAWQTLLARELTAAGIELLDPGDATAT
jgi:predicted nucleotide-binding protein